MDAVLPTRLSARDGRRFALTLSVAFAAVGGLLWWRGHELPMMAILTLSGLLLAAGLLVPTALGPPQRAWMAMAVAMSRITTPVFLAVLYFGVFLPTGLIRRTFGRSPVARGRATSHWYTRPEGGRKSDLKRQF